MEDQLANRVFDLIKNGIHSSRDFAINENLSLVTYNFRKETRHRFHPWVDGKECIGGFLISNRQEELWFVFVDWYENANFYLIIFNAERQKVLAEFHKTESIDSDVKIKWKYNPTKRDGRNEERKELFTGQYGSTNVRIDLPKDKAKLDDFLNDVFFVIDCRYNSDNLIP